MGAGGRRVDRSGRGMAIGALVAVAGFVLAGCGLAVAARGPAATATVTIADPTATTPNYIFPLESLAYFSPTDGEFFATLMYRPLYWFGRAGQPLVNPSESLARMPVFSDGGRRVTITLKPWRWSDGSPITSRDVAFWENLVVANKADWAGYVPGGYPDNIVRVQVEGPTRISFTFNKAYSQHWLLYNELSQITPIPQHAWDRLRAGGRVGAYDATRAGAVAVYRFLNLESQTLNSYSTNPLWQVVDGPFRLARGVGFDPSTGAATLVRNPAYSGPRHGNVGRVDLVPFTSATAEFDSLREGTIDYGYLPTTDLSQQSALNRIGYRAAPWTAWSISFIAVNFTNPKVGVILRQLYVRQAMQHLIDQPAYITHLLKVGGYPTYGPVPIRPLTPFATRYERSDPYPFSVAAARGLLSEHGWRVAPRGTDTCVRPGAGPSECGAGIHRGAALRLLLLYPTGSPSLEAEMEALQSAFSEAGITVVPSGVPGTTVLAAEVPCEEPTSSTGCAWGLGNNGPPDWIYTPDIYPTGGEIFACNAGSNAGNYCDPTMNRLIAATHLAQGLEPLYRYEDYAARMLPVLWFPNSVNQISEISTRLHGALPQDPTLNIYPQDWSISG